MSFPPSACHSCPLLSHSREGAGMTARGITPRCKINETVIFFCVIFMLFNTKERSSEGHKVTFDLQEQSLKGKIRDDTWRWK
jgi:hypothetical protein